jgi:hypothetical protein
MVAILFTWRLYYGGLELRANGEVLASFDFHRRWTIPFDLVCMAVLVGAMAYGLVCDLVRAWRTPIACGHQGATTP